MYKKVSTDLKFVEREKQVRKFWEENKIFEKSVCHRQGKPNFTFYDGPPTANGKPHIGHVLTRVIKDLIPRYRTMKGYDVPRKAGWDTHGLPVELEIEKELGINGKEQIEAYGIKPFIGRCKESVWKYKGMWEDFSGTVGFWADMEHPYVTYMDDYIESEWWSLKQIFDKGLLYKGFKIVPYCPRCGTPLSSHEVAQGYKDVKERSAIAKFRVKGEDAAILAWTTTPWTLPSNVALCVNPAFDYVKVKTNAGDTYYLAKSLCDSVLGAGEYSVIKEYKGRELEGVEYEPLFDYAKPDKKCYYVTCADYVTLTDGTGVVHIAPAFGEDDSVVGRQYDLPFVQLVDAKGEMTAETPWAGTFCKDADKLILKALDESGKLFSAPSFEHSYPHCWRCGTPLIYYARDSWFIKMTAVKDDLIRNNNTINWIPESIGKGRFGDWLENVQDWGISRNRYWGTPLPVWECSCGKRHCIGSRAELHEMAVEKFDELELHRPFVDEVKIKCPECGGVMTRVPEVIDCWYDSGAMPFAQHHYPFENKELFDEQFPADFISEAVDQTRGWFYSLLAISTLIFNKAPYKNVIVLGHVQDEFGQKMSKSKGNAVDPFSALEEYGADAIRWYFYTNSAPWLPNKFHGKAVVEGQRKFLGTLWNTYAFYVLYADIDKFNPSEHTLDKSKLQVIDKWLLSKLQTLIKEVDSDMSEYKIPEACRALSEFVDELSNWYVRRCRERYWETGMSDDKVCAYMTLCDALVTFVKLAAPMIPFMSEEIYQNLVRTLDKNAPESIHLCDYPVADESLIDKTLEENMDAVLKIVMIGRACRNSANIKNRQPIGKMYVACPHALEKTFSQIVTDELNVKEIEFVSDGSEFLSYSVKPNLKTVGPKFGAKLGAIRAALSSCDGTAAVRELDRDGDLKLDINGETLSLLREDLLIETSQSGKFVSLCDGDITVALDTTLTDELVEEGYVREIISKVQTMRKEADFNVTDHITLYTGGNVRIDEIIKRNDGDIKHDTLCDEIVFADADGYKKEWDINGEAVTFGVKQR